MAHRLEDIHQRGGIPISMATTATIIPTTIIAITAITIILTIIGITAITASKRNFGAASTGGLLPWRRMFLVDCEAKL
jgi:hypothetical protein